MNNYMTEYKENIFTKIKKFIFNLFKRNKGKHEELNYQTINTNNNSNSNNNFLDEIVVKKSKEEIELLQLQEDYKNNYLYEEEIPENQKNKLIELYKKQNKELREKLMKEKVETKLLISNLKNA